MSRETGYTMRGRGVAIIIAPSLDDGRSFRPISPANTDSRDELALQGHLRRSAYKNLRQLKQYKLSQYYLGKNSGR